MKVFRAELSPQVDVAVDVSDSMFFHEERAARTRGLLQFCLLSAIGTGAQVKIHAVKGRRIIPWTRKMFSPANGKRRSRAFPG